MSTPAVAIGTPRPSRAGDSRTGMLLGLALYVLEAIQSIALIPFFKSVLGAGAASHWVVVTSSVGLVALACAGYFQPLIRNVSAATGGIAGVPLRWTSTRRRMTILGASTLAVAQGCFLVLAMGTHTHDRHGLWPALVYFAAMYLRLGAFHHFILLNGLRQVGKDKQLLIVASAVNLAAVLLLGTLFGNTLALAGGSLLSSALLLVLARRATARCVAPDAPATPAVDVPGVREIGGLLLLAVAGYLNLSTDIVLAARMLPSDAALDYALWSRLLLTQLAIVGLYAQVRFPFWASPSVRFASIVAEVRRAYWLLLVSALVLGAAFLANRELHLVDHGNQLPLWTFALMAVNAYLCCLTVLLGQALTVRSAYSFMRPSIVITCCAPLAAIAFGHFVAAPAFVAGYLLVNLLLFGVVLKCSRDQLARS